ncbi:MAG: hypothetical protein AAGD25_38490 [Cyanobacteria bacterium P01_F01_bin.150]
MTSAKLVDCVECKKAFSSLLETCPHCHTNYPLGVTCYWCQGSLPESSAFRFKSLVSYSNFSHKACYEKLKEISVNVTRLTCPLCGNVDVIKSEKVTNGVEAKLAHHCKNCGHPNSYTLNTYKCHSCSLPIKNGHEKILNSKYGNPTPYSFHKMCFEIHNSACLDTIETLEIPWKEKELERQAKNAKARLKSQDKANKWMLALPALTLLFAIYIYVFSINIFVLIFLDIFIICYCLPGKIDGEGDFLFLGLLFLMFISIFLHHIASTGGTSLAVFIIVLLGLLVYLVRIYSKECNESEWTKFFWLCFSVGHAIGYCLYKIDPLNYISSLD